MSKRCVVIFMASLIGTLGSALASARAPEVWFGGIDPYVYAQRFGGTQYDYLEMFRPDAPWAKSAEHLQVFQVTAAFVLHESDETMKMVFADLKRRHIALGIEEGLLAGMAPSGEKICGRGVEGYAAPDTAKLVATRIKQNGGELRYIAMDEPLWYGHHFQGANACQSSMEDLAREITVRVQSVRQIFPNVEIGDIEPVASPQVPDWNEQILAWTKVYRRIAGEPLTFVHADIVWTGPWQRDLPVLKSGLQREGVKLGIIYNGGGDGRDQNDQVWSETAIHRFLTIEGHPELIPDQAVIETWVRWPTHMLPEDKPGTLTNVLLRYVSGR
jgi:hypothetical protein